ncbi:MAG TPA: ANTAR domain-containing protein [Arthrobacter sp.]|nr:ANTAR domain-containing protein [Arthrobacter sp.]
MEQALTSSRTIGAAIGLLMGSRNIDQDKAFAVLKQASQDSNRKLRELAAELVQSANHPTPRR